MLSPSDLLDNGLEGHTDEKDPLLLQLPPVDLALVCIVDNGTTRADLVVVQLNAQVVKRQQDVQDTSVTEHSLPGYHHLVAIMITPNDRGILHIAIDVQPGTRA